ncbi:MAG: hypothetical protein JOS17DRAFT_106022 [Linnemannia elongata]|nr:MAG: hypothetical protein JOS17DRAFT_106022 [Linnemannia elongata]
MRYRFSCLLRMGRFSLSVHLVALFFFFFFFFSNSPSSAFDFSEVQESKHPSTSAPPPSYVCPFDGRTGKRGPKSINEKIRPNGQNSQREEKMGGRKCGNNASERRTQ